jgi:hypothetical protein
MPTTSPKTALDRRDATRAAYLKPAEMRNPETLAEAETGVAAIRQSLAAAEASLEGSKRELFTSDETFAAWRTGAETACRTYREALVRWEYYREVLRVPAANPFAKSARFLRVEDMRVPQTVAEAEAAVRALEAAIASSRASIARLTRRAEAEARGELVEGPREPNALPRAYDALSRYESALPSMQYHLVSLRGRALGIAAAVQALLDAVPPDAFGLPAVRDALRDVAFVVGLEPVASASDNHGHAESAQRNAA